MERFEMPGLSKYWFYLNGEAENKRTGQMKKPFKHRAQYYFRFWADNGEEYLWVRQQEIIAYGKHLAQMNEPRCGNYMMKFQSKMNKAA